MLTVGLRWSLVQGERKKQRKAIDWGLPRSGFYNVLQTRIYCKFRPEMFNNNIGFGRYLFLAKNVFLLLYVLKLYHIINLLQSLLLHSLL